MSNCANNSIFWGYFSSLDRESYITLTLTCKLSKSLILTRVAPHISWPDPALGPTTNHCIPNILEKQYLHTRPGRPGISRSQDSLHVGRELIRNSKHFYLWHHHSIILHIRNPLRTLKIKFKHHTPPQTSQIFSSFCHEIVRARMSQHHHPPDESCRPCQSLRGQ